MHHHDTTPKVYGLLAEFDSATAIVNAARTTRLAGYTKVDTFTPFPIHELDAALKLPRTKLPWLVLGGGIAGMATGFALQYWASVIEYPLNVGGKPFNSWPAFIVPTFECTILFAALAAVLGMFWLNGLPQPYHPVFNVPHFVEASRSRFFLMILSRDVKFDMARTRNFMQTLEPLTLEEVPH